MTRSRWYVAVAFVVSVAPLWAQDWIEYTDRADRFAVSLPAQPAVRSFTYTSWRGAQLPARAHELQQGPRRYAVTVVDVGMDKDVTKRLAGLAGIPIAPYRAFTRRAYEGGAVSVQEIAASLRLPVFVKPARLGSSVGISRVDAAADLDAALDLALAHDDKVLVEELLAGKEVECSVLGLPPDLATSLVGEITYDAEWYDYEAKYAAGGSALALQCDITREADCARAVAETVATFGGLHILVNCGAIGNSEFGNNAPAPDTDATAVETALESILEVPITTPEETRCGADVSAKVPPVPIVSVPDVATAVVPVELTPPSPMMACVPTCTKP